MTTILTMILRLLFLFSNFVTMFMLNKGLRAYKSKNRNAKNVKPEMKY